MTRRRSARSPVRKINSRNKGACGERELARELTRVLGIEARRGRQFCGSPDSPDVQTSLDAVHFECKRVEKFNLYSALNQATQDAGDKIPVVAHRKNQREWVIVVRLDDLPRLVDALKKYTVSLEFSQNATN